MNDRVSLCITSYNRFDKLSACLESFLSTNTYDPARLQLVIIDNGSTDHRVIEKIKNLHHPFGDYKYLLNEKNDYPFCLRRAKNQARSLADGDFFIDCPDDHLFVVRSSWIKETIKYLKQETEAISSVCHYAYPLYRFSKANNLMSPSSVNSDYFVSHLKGYADYHLMTRAAYEDIGLYREDLSFEPNAESEYMDRSFAMGYRRA